MQFKIFISSVQDEFAEERHGIKEWLLKDPFVSRFVESVFLFEDVPSRGKPPDELYLDEVRASHIYIGLLGNAYYGKKSRKSGVSATEEQNGPSFIVRLWKDTWTPQRLAQLGLSERQMYVMPSLKRNGQITPSKYIELTRTSRNTATRDLNDLVEAGVVRKIGSGKNTFYKLSVCTTYAPSSGTVNGSQSGGVSPEWSLRPLKNKRKTALRDQNHSVGEMRGDHGANVSDIAENGTVNGGVFGGVNTVLELITAHPGLRANALATLAGKGLRTVKRYLGALVLLKQVVFRGAPKNGGYYVVGARVHKESK